MMQHLGAQFKFLDTLGRSFNGMQVVILYPDGAGTAASRKVLDPVIKRTASGTNIIGWDPLRAGVRSFKLDKIVKLVSFGGKEKV